MTDISTANSHIKVTNTNLNQTRTVFFDNSQPYLCIGGYVSTTTNDRVNLKNDNNQSSSFTFRDH